jgi:hypothetical protein
MQALLRLSRSDVQVPPSRAEMKKLQSVKAEAQNFVFKFLRFFFFDFWLFFSGRSRAEADEEA